MTTAETFLDRAKLRDDSRRAAHVANPHRATVRQLIADEIVRTPGRHRKAGAR